MIPKMEMSVKIKNPRAIGRVTKMMSEPPDISSDCLSAASPMGLKIKAIKRGAVANPNLIIKNPTIPKKTMMPISNKEC